MKESVYKRIAEECEDRWIQSG